MPQRARSPRRVVRSTAVGLTVAWLASCSPPPAVDADVGVPGSGIVVDCFPPCGFDPSVTPVTLHLGSVGLATTAAFNLDGINNSTATGGPTVAGCAVRDGVGGTDFAFTPAALATASQLDLDAALRASLSTPKFEVSSALLPALTLELTGLDSPDRSWCVGLRLTVRAPGRADVLVEGRGGILNDVLDAEFDDAVTLRLRPEASPARCVGGACAPGAELPLVLHGLRARILLNPEHTAVLPGSAFGGYVFVTDCADGTVDAAGICQDGAFVAQNPSGFERTFARYAAETGLLPEVRDAVLDTFRAAKDVRMSPGGSLQPCTGWNLASANPNALSITLAIDDGP